jgi:catechol 2,3-dioxygenase-like lactoylglutathione lyase family enzyme
MLDHIGFSVSNVKRSIEFYKAALAPLGITVMMELTAEQTGSYEGAGFGSGGKAYFWIGKGKPVKAPTHVAFTADNRAMVQAFYEAAIKAGGKDNGLPGLRPHYHENYFGAFVLDPDGHNIEAVCHKPA